MERHVLQEFIELYRSEPSLWKVRSPHYNNRTIKNHAYRKMVAKLREIYPNADLDMVKKKVNALRTNYRKELRKVLASRERHALTGEPLYVPSLWYYDLFHFIAEDQEEDGEDGQPPIIDVTAEDGSSMGMMRMEYGGNHLQYEGEDMSDEFEEEFQVSSPEASNHNQQQTTRNYNNNSHPPASKRRRNFFKESEDEEEQGHWYNRLLEQTPPTPPSPPPPPVPLEPEDIFGRYVASKLKHMDKSQQMLSERLISEVLFRGQTGVLTKNSSLSNEEQIATVVKVEE